MRAGRNAILSAAEKQAAALCVRLELCWVSRADSFRQCVCTLVSWIQVIA